jgi:hypothetical protein
LSDAFGNARSHATSHGDRPISFVEAAVTVGVDAIAKRIAAPLSFAGDTGIDEFTVLTGQLSLPEAETNAASGQDGQDIVVGDSITVVVDAVAEFDGGRATVTASVAEVLIGNVVTIVIEAIAEFEGSRSTVSAGIQNTFIDGPVAVVITQITFFISGLTGDGAANQAVIGLTGKDTDGPALSYTFSACHAEGKAVVDDSITVVVEVITALLSRSDPVFAWTEATAGAAAPNTGFADPDITAAGLYLARLTAPIDPFVAETVAVLVFAITELFAGGAGFCITVQRKSVFTADDPSGSYALSSADFAGVVQIRPAFVGGVVTVVVQAIASFIGPRKDRRVLIVAIDRFRKAIPVFVDLDDFSVLGLSVLGLSVLGLSVLGLSVLGLCITCAEIPRVGIRDHSIGTALISGHGGIRGVCGVGIGLEVHPFDAAIVHGDGIEHRTPIWFVSRVGFGTAEKENRESDHLKYCFES